MLNDYYWRWRSLGLTVVWICSPGGPARQAAQWSARWLRVRLCGKQSLWHLRGQKSEETNDSALFGIFHSPLSCDHIPADEVTWPERVQSVAVEMLSWLSVYIYSDTTCRFKNTVELKTPRGNKQTRTRPEYQCRTSDTGAESWRFLHIGQLTSLTVQDINSIPQFSNCPSIWQGSKYGSSDWTNRPTKTPTCVFTC